MNTLYSKCLYIENKNIIINLSSGMKQRGRYCGRQYVRACMCDSLHGNGGPPLDQLTNIAALTTEQINTVYCFFLIPKRAILLPFLGTTVVPVPLRGGPTVWQTKADSKNRQWAPAVCLHNDSRVLHHCSTHTNHTAYE